MWTNGSGLFPGAVFVAFVIAFAVLGVVALIVWTSDAIQYLMAHLELVE